MLIASSRMIVSLPLVLALGCAGAVAQTNGAARSDTKSITKPVSTNPLALRPKEVTIDSPLIDAISQNTPGYSDGYPLGVPRNYAWCSGSFKPVGYNAPPPGFSAVTGWGSVYPQNIEPRPEEVNANIEVANARTYVRLKDTQQWVVLQDQARQPLAGKHFPAAFRQKDYIPMQATTRPDGSVALREPPIGYNDHFWFNERGSYPEGRIDGVYVEMDMRVNDPRAKLLGNVGADWWRDMEVEFLPNLTNNPGAGMSNWVALTPEWKTLRFYSVSTEQFQANPPPMTPMQKEVFTRRFSDSFPHCMGLTRESSAQPR